MVWRQKIWQARDMWQNFFSIKYEKLYKEWFDTLSRNLAQQSIEVHFSVLCSCHQDRITSGGQWTSKTKVSFTLRRHFAQMNFVSVFSHNTGIPLCIHFWCVSDVALHWNKCLTTIKLTKKWLTSPIEAFHVEKSSKKGQTFIQREFFFVSCGGNYFWPGQRRNVQRICLQSFKAVLFSYLEFFFPKEGHSTMMDRH